jgi:hypothetical protein
MKRFFAKIARFFWSWGFLKFVLGIIALIIFFYVEEDWRGARAWAATKAEWEVKGESFNYNKFIPPPVPDDQNLAALPLFKLEPVNNSDGTTYIGQVALRRAMRDDLPSFDFPQFGNWQTGELPDMGKIKKTMAANYALAFKNVTPPDDALAQFNAIYPFFADFIAAAVTHPVFRFNMDYSILPPAARPLGPITDPIKLSKILTLNAVIALGQNQPVLALQDVEANCTLSSGVKRDPSLVGGLVAIGVMAIGHGAIYEGLAQHDWNDAQLVELDQTLKPINFLADYQFAMRSEIAQSIANFDFFERASRTRMQKIFGGAFTESPVALVIGVPWPSGWWDGNKKRIATVLFQSLATVDPQAHLFFPKVADNLQHQIEQAKANWHAFAPWNIFADVAVGPITNSTHQFAQAQGWVDEARIACALERYRLAHGVYPGSLDALVPACIDELPHDIMNGEPYHYRLRADGTFLLYSVGWNQTDDGGKVVYKRDSPTQVDYTQGDWVWPTPRYSR